MKKLKTLSVNVMSKKTALLALMLVGLFKFFDVLISSYLITRVLIDILFLFNKEFDKICMGKLNVLRKE